LAKPFNIQAPEDIAKEYAGNKQMIAQAAQMGVIDPTAAVLAGMFIDRMRSAQVMEAGQLPSVAQQVLGGPPPAPPAPPAGLGATPEAAAMPPMGPPPEMGLPPEMGAPPPQEMPAPQEEMPMMAEGGMVSPYASGGGLSDVPLPDGMFDEPSNGGFGDGYAGGGMVAFADGGPTGGFGSFIEQTVRKLDPNIQISGRARTPARNAQLPGSVPNSYHLIDAARDIRTPDGMKKSDFIAQLKSVFGSDYDILPSGGNSVHIEPGPKLGEKVRAGARPSGAPFIAPERDIGTAEGRASSREDLFQDLQRRFGSTAEEQDVENKRMARAKEMGSDEYYEKQRKESMYQTLAEIGFNMASSKSPNLLQAIGEAASAAMPGARADKKERKALKDRALDIMGDINGLKRKENLQLFGMAVELDKEGRQQEQFEQKIGLDERQLDLAERKLDAEIAAAKAGGDRISFDELLAAQVMSGAISEPMAEALLLRRGGTEGGGQTVEDIRAKVQAGRTGGGGAAPNVIDFKNLN
jgi:hypothetical protein